MCCVAWLTQEAELQRHRRRLVREGAIQELAGARLGGTVTHAATDSSANFEVRRSPLHASLRTRACLGMSEGIAAARSLQKLT
jgi:hypothetical protein